MSEREKVTHIRRLVSISLLMYDTYMCGLAQMS